MLKNVFNVFFYFGHVFTFLTFFYFPNVFFIFTKSVGKVWSGKQQINKKHFQNNSNKIDLIFLLHVERPEMPPYKLLLIYYV